LQAQDAAIAGLKASIRQTASKIDSIRSNYRSQLETERVELIATLNRSSTDLSKSKIKRSLLEIVSPHDGIVKDLAVTTSGAVVSAGALLMNIIPQKEPLQAEVFLRGEDVGFVFPGQKAQLKISAFPFQRYGLLEGTVALISADTTDSQKTLGQQGIIQNQVTYKAIVSLTSSVLNSVATNERLPLSTGMVVTAEIHQRQRTVLEYLISPIQKASQEAGRER
jgi:hemolysin D